MLKRTTARPMHAAFAASRVKALLAHPDEWLPRVRFDAGRRWYERIVRERDHEIWLLTWLPEDATGIHDHGGSSGAFAVALGSLEEHEVRNGLTISLPLRSGDVRSFGPEHVHEVMNLSGAPAVSLHAYAPCLETMNRYELRDGAPAFVTREHASDW
jgi:hypothetical protein